MTLESGELLASAALIVAAIEWLDRQQSANSNEQERR